MVEFVQNRYHSASSNPTNISSKFTHDISQERIIAIGDVHGDLEGLKENLKQARLIDDLGNWIGGNQTFVQLGDIVDRGPHSEATWKYLGLLQKQASDHGGKVIRLVGNHDLMWLEGNFRYAAPEDTASSKIRVVKKISKDIQKCWNNVYNAQAGYITENGKVAFLHAGLIKEMDQLLRKEIAAKTGEAVNKISNGAVIERINEIMRNAFSSSGKPNFDHPIFDAGPSRGGDGIDGVFWADKSVLDLSSPESLVQIVGHNASHGGSSPIRVDPNHRIVYADGGMVRGNRCFIEIVKDTIYSHCKEKGEWIKKVL